jgi:putative membrane protein
MADWDAEARTEPDLGVNDRPEDPRVRFAAERTLLAWIRTGLALMGFGFVVARFGLFLLELRAAGEKTIHSHGVSLWAGIVLIVLGVAVNIFAAMQHHRFLLRLNTGKPYLAPKWPLGIIVAVLLALLGLSLAIYLMVVG